MKTRNSLLFIELANFTYNLFRECSYFIMITTIDNITQAGIFIVNVFVFLLGLFILRYQGCWNWRSHRLGTLKDVSKDYADQPWKQNTHSLSYEDKRVLIEHSPLNNRAMYELYDINVIQSREVIHWTKCLMRRRQGAPASGNVQV